MVNGGCAQRRIWQLSFLAIMTIEVRIRTQNRTRFADFIIASVQQIAIVELLKKKEKRERHSNVAGRE